MYHTIFLIEWTLSSLLLSIPPAVTATAAVPSPVSETGEGAAADEGDDGRGRGHRAVPEMGSKVLDRLTVIPNS